MGFFVLQEGGLKSRHDAEVDTVEPVNLADAPRCPRCGGFIGLMKWLPPYRVNLELHGEEFGDLIKHSAYALLISERFARFFRAEGLTGLEGFHPVEVLRVRPMRKGTRKSPPVPRYCVASTCFGRAAVDPVLNRMRISEPPPCSECRLTDVEAIHGIVLEPGTWQGEDIFRPRGLPGDLVVSDRFKHFIERHELTNIRLTSAEQYVWDPSHRGAAPLPTS
jgi:hypothetical protein